MNMENKVEAHLYSLFKKAGTFFNPEAGLMLLLGGLNDGGGMVVNAWLVEGLPALLLKSCIFEGSL